MIFRSLNDERLKLQHYPLEVVENVNTEVIGVVGTPFILKEEEAFVVLLEKIETPTILRELINNKKALVINDGKGIK